jgi:hypothetical protein
MPERHGILRTLGGKPETNDCELFRFCVRFVLDDKHGLVWLVVDVRRAAKIGRVSSAHTIAFGQSTA